MLNTTTCRCYIIHPSISTAQSPEGFVNDHTDKHVYIMERIIIQKCERDMVPGYHYTITVKLSLGSQKCEKLEKCPMWALVKTNIWVYLPERTYCHYTLS